MLVFESSKTKSVKSFVHLFYTKKDANTIFYNMLELVWKFCELILAALIVASSSEFNDLRF